MRDTCASPESLSVPLKDFEVRETLLAGLAEDLLSDGHKKVHGAFGGSKGSRSTKSDRVILCFGLQASRRKFRERPAFLKLLLKN